MERARAKQEGWRTDGKDGPKHMRSKVSQRMGTVPVHIHIAVKKDITGFELLSLFRIYPEFV